MQRMNTTRTRKMRILLLFFILSIIGCAGECAQSELQEVVNFPEMQVTGVAVSNSGRIFVNFPYWSDKHTLSVAEIVDGKPKPFPDDEWNGPGQPAAHFICVQSVYVDAKDVLWILDPAAPKSGEIVSGGPKLVEVDLKTNNVIRTFSFDETIAPKKSYLNDVRVDEDESHAFITDSGMGALVIVDLRTGKARRLLAQNSATKGEPGFQLSVDKRELIEMKTGKPPVIHSDGIALDSRNGYLYFHALTARTLYRVKTEYLTDEKITDAALNSKVEKVAQTPPCDGMIMGPDGMLYLTDLEHAAVVRIDPANWNLSTMVSSEKLLWPDTMAVGPDGVMYVTASQIENSPRFNSGKDVRKEPYRLFKFKPGAGG